MYGHYLKDYERLADLLTMFGANAAYYGLLLVLLGPALYAAVWPGLKRDSKTRLALIIAGVTLIPILLFTFHHPHYLLQALTYLWFAAIWSLAGVRRPAVRYGVMGISAIACVSLSVSAMLTIQANTPDPRIAAGAYLVAHTRPGDTVALEDFDNAGSSAVVPECPESLAAKAQATVESGLGSGQTLKAWSKMPKQTCRRIISVARSDIFAGTRFAGNWTLDYTKTSHLTPPLPEYLATHTPLGHSPLALGRRPFDTWAQGHYVPEKVFATLGGGPFVSHLLESSYFSAAIYVYRLQGPAMSPTPSAFLPSGQSMTQRVTVTGDPRYHYR